VVFVGLGKRRRNWLKWGGITLVLTVFGLFCLEQLMVLAMSWVFPGSQFSYSSDSKRLHVFKLTVLNDPKSMLIQVPDDYVTGVYPGGYGGESEVNLTAYLPDMISEPDFYRRHPEAQKAGQMTDAELEQMLLISLSEGYAGPDDPTGIKAAVTDGAGYAASHYPKLSGNPYPAFDAYISTDTGGSQIDGADDTETYYIPKNSRDYYVACSGERSSVYSNCTIIYIFEKKLEVDVDTNPKNLSKINDIIVKVSKLLENSIIDDGLKRRSIH